MTKCKVAVVMGGISPEHNISIKSGATVIAHLRRTKYLNKAVVIQSDGQWCLGDGPLTVEELKALSVCIRPEIALAKLMDWGIDVAFLALHGPNGEDGSVQGFFQAAGIPYTGSGVEASAASMNKYTSKVLASQAGLRTPPAAIIDKCDWIASGEKMLQKPISEFGFPLYVKTVRSGSSIGVHRVEKKEKLNKVMERAFALDDEAIIEKEIKGRELTCGVIHSKLSDYEVLPPVEIRPKGHSFFTFESKYNSEQAEEICPAELTQSEESLVKDSSLSICKRMGTRGICRIDYIINAEGLWFLELNTIPGLTPESIVLKEAKAAGMDLETLLDRLIEPARNEFRSYLDPLFNDEKREGSVMVKENRIRVGVNGAKGSMGQLTIEGLKKEDDLDLVFMADIEDDLGNAIQKSKAKVVVDFTVPQAVFQNTLKIIKSGAHPVVGTTGLEREELQTIENELLNKGLGGIVASNFSLGALLMLKLAEEAARHMNACEIIEFHHDKKIDSPSGTALQTAYRISPLFKQPKKRKVDKDDKPQPLSRGLQEGNVKIHSIRLPGYLAQQQIVFGGEGETLTIAHNTLSRECFLPGIIRAIREVVTIKGLQIGLRI